MEGRYSWLKFLSDVMDVTLALRMAPGARVLDGARDVICLHLVGDLRPAQRLLRCLDALPI